MIKNISADIANKRLDKAASELFNEYSRTQIKKWIIEGRIIVNGELSRPKEIVQENDEIEMQIEGLGKITNKKIGSETIVVK